MSDRTQSPAPPPAAADNQDLVRQVVNLPRGLVADLRSASFRSKRSVHEVVEAAIRRHLPDLKNNAN